MMSTRAESLTVSILAVLMGLGLIGIVATFSQSTSNGDSLQGVHARLDALETQKSPATARRFTADDGEALMRCLRIPNQTRAREECISTVERRIKNR
jgi:hypothetical protein